MVRLPSVVALALPGAFPAWAEERGVLAVDAEARRYAFEPAQRRIRGDLCRPD